MTDKKPKATLEQKKFMAEKNAEAMRRYTRQSDLEKNIIHTRNDIADATIGYGKAIRIMSDKLESMLSELKRLKETEYADTAFEKEFGVKPYSLDFS